jgi:hypothetical protein
VLILYAQDEMVGDIDLSLRFKYGIHTVFILVDPKKTFSAIANKLLEVLQERYPDGLKTERDSPETALPDDASRIEFAVLKVSADPSQGWRPLRADEDDTPVSKGLKDNQMVAFAFRDEDMTDFGEVVFEVAFPTYEDEEEMEQ